MSNDVNTEVLFNNLKLNDNRVEADVIDVYYSNLDALADPSIMSIDPTGDVAQDKIENDRVSEFFKKI